MDSRVEKLITAYYHFNRFGQNLLKLHNKFREETINILLEACRYDKEPNDLEMIANAEIKTAIILASDLVVCSKPEKINTNKFIDSMEELISKQDPTQVEKIYSELTRKWKYIPTKHNRDLNQLK